MIAKHAPKGWEERFNRHGRLATLIRDGREFDLVTLAADIRHSTILQKEAISFQLHALVLTRFVEAAGDTVKVVHEGWFDKFTGDGFLAYWVLRLSEPGAPIPLPIALAEDNEHPGWGQIQSALNSTMVLQQFFTDRVLRDFKSNSKNFPEGVGLAIGLDDGPATFGTVAGDLTILGAPVVGAVRMVDAALAGEVVANVQLGAALKERHDKDSFFGLTGISEAVRASKEFPEGQEVYLLDIDLAEIREAQARREP